MNDATELLLSLLVLAGAIFTFIGSFGLARLDDFYTRLHGPTKATTLGVGSLLIASATYFSVTGDSLSLHEVLVALFLFITAPVSAHLLAKAALHQRLTSLAPLPENAENRPGDALPAAPPSRAEPDTRGEIPNTPGGAHDTSLRERGT
ncbi:MAG: Na+/H+ antiporter subunit G [Gammaproteobacteria bacterium]|nr:Na+/H+ antiporter subunit G [Rhodocyclaceae bacterium]MBU3909086.1 Na+/H+ antiporter subunit G [Gammaproteobacteria bacterium]MBU3990807.1 Na+/H+ antiporter subunit G [Gammaproteobacteria bacterium]MBU4003297.1 Na+/H+ antiporter subunit G [Gammaproteobacteria bacterium]MBU4022129.1 Na+/H+ antiporter subunit G [Gammaproteobacteria bacterium]